LNFTILSAMVGLLIIVLIVLTISWVWTCWTTGRKKTLRLETRPPWQQIRY
jgi:hypothetical protein